MDTTSVVTALAPKALTSVLRPGPGVGDVVLLSPESTVVSQGLAMPCVALSCVVLSRLVLLSLVSSCVVLSCVVLSCLVACSVAVFSGGVAALCPSIELELCPIIELELCPIIELELCPSIELEAKRGSTSTFASPHIVPTVVEGVVSFDTTGLLTLSSGAVAGFHSTGLGEGSIGSGEGAIAFFLGEGAYKTTMGACFRSVCEGEGAYAWTVQVVVSVSSGAPMGACFRSLCEGEGEGACAYACTDVVVVVSVEAGNPPPLTSAGMVRKACFCVVSFRCDGEEAACASSSVASTR